MDKPAEFSDWKRSMKTKFFTVLVLLLMGNLEIAKSVEVEHPALKQVKGLVAYADSETHPWDVHGALKVRSNGHWLEYTDGKDFFLLSDTAWELCNLSDANIDIYLNNRKANGFNAVQFCPGESFYIGSMPYSSVSPDTKKWAIVDFIVDACAERGMYAIIVPLWGSAMNKNTWTNPYNQMYTLGAWISARYSESPNVLYCAAGEYTSIGNSDHSSHPTDPLTDTDNIGWVRRMGQGLAANATTGQLITLHGRLGYGATASDVNYRPSDHYHGESWLNFYGNQTYHFLNKIDNMLLNDYNLNNPKPTFNMEPGYEGANYAPDDYSATAWGSRMAAWWSAFNGACGHSYGHVGFASMCSNLSNPWGTRGANYLQPSALNAEGGADMQHVKALALSNGLTYVPDQSVITSSTGSDTGTSPDKRLAVLDAHSDFAYVYLTQGGSVTVNMAKIDRENVTARWFDPRTGSYKEIGNYSNSGDKTFTTATSGRNNDWVLVLEGQ